MVKSPKKLCKLTQDKVSVATHLILHSGIKVYIIEISILWILIYHKDEGVSIITKLLQ